MTLVQTEPSEVVSPADPARSALVPWDDASFGILARVGTPAGLGVAAQLRIGPFYAEGGGTFLVVYSAAWGRLGVESPPWRPGPGRAELGLGAAIGTEAVAELTFDGRRGATFTAQVRYRDASRPHLRSGLDLDVGAVRWASVWSMEPMPGLLDVPAWRPVVELALVAELH